MKTYITFVTLVLSGLRLVRAQNVSITIPTQSPSSAFSVAQDLVAFSIEQDRWTDWIGTDTPNTFWLNALENLKQLSGLPTRIRIGANTADRTNFSFDVEYATDVFPATTAAQPYSEATNITVGQGFYDLAAHLPSKTPVIWGVNFGRNNLTAAYLQTVAICKAFTSSAMMTAGVTLQAIEIGNEADFYHNNGVRNSSYSILNYVPEWTTFATNVTKTANALLGKEVALQGIAFAESSHTTSGFSPQAAFELGILESNAGSQVKWISQHQYSASVCSGASLLQNLMNKAFIRGNVTAFSPDISATHALGLPYVFGEANSYPCHGVIGVSDTAGASLWALYVLFSAITGVEHVYFHEGIGYKYNFIQPVTLTRSIDDGSALPTPLAPHIQPTYYAAIIAAEAIGTSGATTISELTLNNPQLSGYAFYENGALKRALFINLVAFNGDGATRSAVHVALAGSTGNITVKRLSIPTAESTSGVTWGGQTYETSDALVSGKLQTQTVPVSAGVDVHETEVVMVTFQ
ncbi:glycoside hydrolase family 79 protein [Peniophora sp. CONT]|nr:glycoside hydrolase family 79 protein [Peniophora sp. CONT]